MGDDMAVREMLCGAGMFVDWTSVNTISVEQRRCVKRLMIIEQEARSSNWKGDYQQGVDKIGNDQKLPGLTLCEDNLKAKPGEGPRGNEHQ